MFYVIFATHNGASKLPQTLATLSALRVPEGQEVAFIAIDSASTDESVKILESYKDKLPLTVLREPQKGKNLALNRALDHLQGKAVDDAICFFTDDDVFIDPDILIHYDRAIRANPDYSIFGGAIIPHWPFEPPAWLFEVESEFGVLFAQTYAKTGPCAAKAIWGPNMVMRYPLVKTSRFNTAIGPDGSASYAMGGEAEMLNRQERGGARAYFVAEAFVKHSVRESQMDKEWVLGRAFKHGKGFGRMKRQKGERLLTPGFLRQWLTLEAKALLTALGLRRDTLLLLYKRNWNRGKLAAWAGRASGKLA